MTLNPEFPVKRPHLAHWLSWSEFKMAWAYQWCEWFFAGPQFTAMSEDERAVFNGIESALDWAIRELRVRHKMEFEAVEVQPNGALRLMGPPVDLKNEIFLERVRRGKQPHPIHNIQHLLDEMEARGLQFPQRRFYVECLEQCKADREAHLGAVGTESRQVMNETIEEMMKTLGLQKAARLH